MLELLQFVFSSFWVWIGSAMLVLIVGLVLVGMVEALRK